MKLHVLQRSNSEFHLLSFTKHLFDPNGSSDAMPFLNGTLAPVQLKTSSNCVIPQMPLDSFEDPDSLPSSQTNMTDSQIIQEIMGGLSHSLPMSHFISRYKRLHKLHGRLFLDNLLDEKKSHHSGHLL